MAGRIRDADIEALKQRLNIADVVADYVTLKRAGVDSLKGLCPFHDERTPSFNVRPSAGYYHCFGCGESGDMISFVQRLDHLTFTEAVERLAAKAGMVLQYDDNHEPGRPEGPRKTRLYEANRVAQELVHEALASEEGAAAREFLTGRGFGEASWGQFGVGYSPKSWDSLLQRLRERGFRNDEIVASGLVSQGNRGTYDRFRGRVMWPIRDTSGQVIGFGARKLYDDDQGPKYLNSPETPIYQKSRALYGIDLAKRAISRGKRAIIVEGYTDVMACHLAGVHEAVATCGTAFGADHISVLRRVLGDDSRAEVIFTFDPDEAGTAAALKAFQEEQRFQAQTFVAQPPPGLDPSDLRQHHGDEALRAIFDHKLPMFEFALRQSIAGFDLNTVEGRALALRAAAPIVARIRDQLLRPGYTRELARMLGMELEDVQREVTRAGAAQPLQNRVSTRDADPPRPAGDRLRAATLPRDAPTKLERDAMMAMLQRPEAIESDLMEQAVTAKVNHPALRVIRDAIAANLPATPDAAWVERVVHSVPADLQDLTRELAVLPLPERTPEALTRYARGIVVSLLDRDLVALKHELMSWMSRIGDPNDERFQQTNAHVMELEAARRALRAKT